MTDVGCVVGLALRTLCLFWLSTRTMNVQLCCPTLRGGFVERFHVHTDSCAYLQLKETIRMRFHRREVLFFFQKP